jgi:hypothetical protein
LLHDEFESLRAQLLARRPYVSLMDALAEARNEEVHLHDASLLQSATILAARSLASCSLSTHPTTSVPLASPPVVPPAAQGESGGLHCAHCGHDGHVEQSATGRRKLRLTVLHRVLVVMVLEYLREVLLVQRHRRFSCCFVALRLLRHQELLLL